MQFVDKKTVLILIVMILSMMISYQTNMGNLTCEQSAILTETATTNLEQLMNAQTQEEVNIIGRRITELIALIMMMSNDEYDEYNLENYKTEEEFNEDNEN